MRNCRYCDATFIPEDGRQKYCSVECRKRYGNNIKGATMRECKGCHEVSLMRPSAMFCSVACARRGQRKGVCKTCGTEFSGNNGKKFCSQKCRNADLNARHNSPDEIDPAWDIKLADKWLRSQAWVTSLESQRLGLQSLGHRHTSAV